MSDLLVGNEGFDDTRLTSRLAQLLLFMNAGVSSFAREMRLAMRHSLSFTHVALLPFQCTRRVFNKFALRGNSHPTVIDGVGSRAETISFVALLENLCRLNTTKLALHIRSKVGGHFLYVQILQSFQIPKLQLHSKFFITSAIKP